MKHGIQCNNSTIHHSNVQSVMKHVSGSFGDLRVIPLTAGDERKEDEEKKEEDQNEDKGAGGYMGLRHPPCALNGALH
eukprot:4388462-Amphidinium_carterae.1